MAGVVSANDDVLVPALVNVSLRSVRRVNVEVDVPVLLNASERAVFSAKVDVLVPVLVSPHVRSRFRPNVDVDVPALVRLHERRRFSPNVLVEVPALVRPHVRSRFSPNVLVLVPALVSDSALARAITNVEAEVPSLDIDSGRARPRVKVELDVPSLVNERSTFAPPPGGAAGLTATCTLAPRVEDSELVVTDTVPVAPVERLSLSKNRPSDALLPAVLLALKIVCSNAAGTVNGVPPESMPKNVNSTTLASAVAISMLGVVSVGLEAVVLDVKTEPTTSSGVVASSPRRTIPPAKTPTVLSVVMTTLEGGDDPRTARNTFITPMPPPVEPVAISLMVIDGVSVPFAPRRPKQM